MNYRTLALLLAGVAVGFAWGHAGFEFLLCASILVPLLWGMADNRWAAGAITLAYYLAASHGLPFGVGVFFAESAPAWFGWALWAGVGLLNAALWTLFWHQATHRRALGAIAALVLSAVPPVGVIGWTNPLIASGWLFPSMGFIGLAFMGGLMAALAVRRWPVVAMLAGAAIVANVSAFIWPKTHAPEFAAWSAQDTQFQRLKSSGLDQLNTRIQFVIGETTSTDN